MERGAWDPPEASRRPWTHTGMWSVLPLNRVRTSGKLLIAGLTWKCLRDMRTWLGLTKHQSPTLSSSRTRILTVAWLVSGSGLDQGNRSVPGTSRLDFLGRSGLAV